jgi:RHS repeat-associated protein
LYDGLKEIGTREEFRILGNTPHAEIGAAVLLGLQGKIYAPIHDLQGHVSLLISLDDGTLNYAQYSAFGEEIVPMPVHNPWRAFSKRVEGDLVDFGRRFYSPKLGRFWTPDPAGAVDGNNRYLFLKNNPLFRIDAFGLITFDFKTGWQNCPWGSPYSYTPSHTPPLGFLPPIAWNRAQIEPCQIPFMQLFPNPSPLYYVNGIQNSWTENRSGASRLQRTFEGHASVFPFHSESLGWFQDLRSVTRSKLDVHYDSPAIYRLRNSLRADILTLDALQDHRKIFLTGFSRGSSDIFHAVKDFSREQKDRLIITACGPIMVLPKDLGFSVTNLIAVGDWCSRLCNFGAHLDPNVRVEFLTGNGFWSREHYFRSETYQRGIREFEVPLYETFGR